MNIKKQPPQWASRLLEWFCADHLLEEVQGDLEERFQRNVDLFGERSAKRQYVANVLGFMRPFAMKNEKSSTPLFMKIMISNYFKIALRNLVKHKGYSFINIFGLATGMAVTMLIGLWVHDELSYDKSFKNYDRLGQLWQFVTFDVEKSSYTVLPIPLAKELRTKYPDVEAVSLSSNNLSLILDAGEKKVERKGNYVEPFFADMLSVNMLSGSKDGLKDVNSVLLSESSAEALFGDEDPLNKIIKIDNQASVKVAGVYEDFPFNTSFNDVSFLLPWSLYEATNPYVKSVTDAWDDNSFQIFVQLKAGADFDALSSKIRDIRMKMNNPPSYKPEFFIHPMSQWHLYSDFKNGVNRGGLIQFVWLFGIIGGFVLLLACINFMNLSTARSEKRAKEVGIRKAVGSIRAQLVMQFFSESLMVVLIAFILSLIIVLLTLPLFNEVAAKQIRILWENPLFWIAGLGFTLLTSVISGSYPAFYLSSFQAVKVLKGTFRVGRFAAVPRKVLVVTQFTVSVTLIIGTVIVFRQIQHVKNLPVGYNRQGIIEIRMNTPELEGHYDELRAALHETGAVVEMAESTGSITGSGGGTTNLSWRGKEPDSRPLLIANNVTHDYGKTIGWEVSQGRDFSRNYSTDSSSIILSETTLRLMGFKNPLEEMVTYQGKPFKVIGIVKDIIKESPFQEIKPAFYVINYKAVDMIVVKLAQGMPVAAALEKVAPVFRKRNPSSPFTYNFVDVQYGKKFNEEERIGKLSLFFTILAIMISCLGLFGLASFIAEQRTKEIGVRKVLGASVMNLWGLLSRDFLILITISLFIASPVAYYFMNKWIEGYVIKTDITWWIFVVSGAGALLISLLTVSFQAIKAALMNPVKSLRSD
jgi:putative ABC transport system permease protein